MLYSMTGYGRAEATFKDKTILVEVKSLNGKQFDLRLNIPFMLKPYEVEIRNKLNETLLRGSVESTITIKSNGISKPVTVNKELAKSYYQPIVELADELGIPKENILSTLLKMPDVVSSSSEVLTEEEWKQIQDLLQESIKALMQHRLEEGKSVEKDLLERVAAIEAHQVNIEKFEPNRRVKIKEGLVKLLEQHVGPDKYDNNRLEQELIYYIEKIDISEEKVRLNNHCTYFKTVLKEAEASKGKKLSFILQEMGREINTTGSKANDMEIQKSVILMKDELEKAKEQILNVL
ncbi:MAG: YicC family protein [Chitinophagaceae bacterium]|nr:YicC family protein [Chitinophagaceae bacterium]